MGLHLKGIGSVEKELLALVRRVPHAAAVALNEVAEETMLDAREHTPVKHGVLKASGVVLKHAQPERLEAVLSFGNSGEMRRAAGEVGAALVYGTEYAAAVHERTDVSHQVGEAKFLEHALNRREKTFHADIARKIGEVAGL